jgi:O-6-methylguanine DNA methyltransferase
MITVPEWYNASLIIDRNLEAGREDKIAIYSGDEQVSYGELARRIGRPAAVRAVGLANGANPISVVVPCHRVIGKAGDLTGYHWGLTRKRAMLGWEAGKVAAAA